MTSEGETIIPDAGEYLRLADSQHNVASIGNCMCVLRGLFSYVGPFHRNESVRSGFFLTD